MLRKVGRCESEKRDARPGLGRWEVEIYDFMCRTEMYKCIHSRM